MSARDPLGKYALTPRELTELLALQAAGTAFLAWRDDADAVQFLELGGDAATIGRGAGNTIQMPWDAGVSGVHAELRVLGPEWTVVDDGLSINGTWVDGERVVGRKRLVDNARIRVGSTIIAYRARSVEAAERTTTLSNGDVQREQVQGNDRDVLVALCEPMMLGDAEEPMSNPVIAAHAKVYVGEEGVRRCLTRLFKLFDVTEEPKRKRLAQRAIALGIVRRSDYV